MQTLSWYLSRLRAMSAGEIAWRAQSTVRDAVDRVRVPLKLYPHTNRRRRQSSIAAAGPRWCPVPLGAWQHLAGENPAAAWRARLVARADRIAAHRLSFFDLEDVHLGDPIDWNREHAAGRPTPLAFAPSIDYRDYGTTGDAKVAWEPNRHHQLVVLGRAYRATGDRKYAAAVLEQMTSWIGQNPFGRGMNWRSPLELAIRVINWTWALDLVADSGLLTSDLEAAILEAVTLHVWEIARKYSRGSSANNHRIGEACGVFVACSYFPDVPHAARLGDESHRILSEEILRQTYESGCTREQAFGYHLFVIQFFLAAGLAARRTGRDFEPAFWSRLERMFAFAGALAEGGPPPFFGDSDDGRVLDLGDAPADVESLMGVGRALFGEGPFDRWTAASSEAAYWLFGSAADAVRRPPAPSGAGDLESIAFADAGYYLLQYGGRQSRDRVSVVFDCGELGFGSLAAHGHADALSVAVRAFGVDVLVDPGTYDYFSFPEWRRYLRGTSAHNTIVVDGADQSAPLGSFLWGRRAEARCLEWAPRPGGGRVGGTHDGYLTLADPVECRRTLELDRASSSLVISDAIQATAEHDIALRFHLSERCEARAEGHRVAIDLGVGRAVLVLDDRLSIAMSRGSAGPDGGWVSRGYHRKAPAWTVTARLRHAGPLALRTVLQLQT